MTTLEGLLAQVRQEIATKQARRKTNGFAYHPDREADWCEVYRHAGWEARVWHTVCTSCGAEQTGLEGLYELRKHPRLPDTISRRVTAETFDAVPDHLQLAVSLHSEQIPTCLECLVNDPVLIKDLINAQAEVNESESEVAYSGAPGAGCEGEDPAS